MGGGAPTAVVIGASTGGPAAIEAVLKALPADFPAPVAVCQHMPEGFTAGWARRLSDLCSIRVCEATDRQPFERGRVHIGPIGKHMRLRRTDLGVRIALTDDATDALHVPSIDTLLGSAADAYGSRVLGVLLTGLGSDGAVGMLAIRRAGGHTIVQAPGSCMAPSMPASAVQLGAAAEAIPLHLIPARILDMVGQRTRKPG